MSVLGIRCSNKDFTYSVLTGSKENPCIQLCTSVAIPLGYKRPHALYWMVQEVEGIIKKYDTQKVTIKRFEGKVHRKIAFEERIELEAAVYIAGGNNGINSIFKKVKSTIAKDLGLKGRAHYLKTELDISVIPDFDSKSEKEKDAILAGWSEL
jgi:hypothetical protein